MRTKPRKNGPFFPGTAPHSDGEERCLCVFAHPLPSLTVAVIPANQSRLSRGTNVKRTSLSSLFDSPDDRLSSHVQGLSLRSASRSFPNDEPPGSSGIADFVHKNEPVKHYADCRWTPNTGHE